MKAAIALVVVILSLCAGASAQLVGPLNLTTVTLGARVNDRFPRGISVGDATSWVFQVRQRGTNKIIGNATLLCTALGQGGVYGAGIADCQGTYVLPLGKIRVGGTRHGRFEYILVVVGGTGIYVGAKGTLRAHNFGPGRELVTIELE